MCVGIISKVITKTNPTMLSIVYLYICFHSIIVKTIYTYNVVGQCNHTSYNTIDLFEDEQIFYAYILHTLMFSMLLISARFMFNDPRMTINTVCTLPYIILYHNVYNFVTFYSKIPIAYLQLSISGMWLFTSPYILYIFTKTYHTNGLVPNMHIYSDVCMHAINFMRNVYEVLSLRHTFYVHRFAFEIVMYALYATTLYNVYKCETVYKYYIIYAWLIIGVNETLYVFDMITPRTYIMYTMINDVYAKCVLFGLHMYKHVSVNLMASAMTLKDIKTMYKIKSMITSINGSYTQRSMQEDVSNILNKVDIKNVKHVMCERVLPKTLTHKLMHQIIEEKGRAVSDVVIMFSDVVNYSRFAQIESDTHVLNTLQNLYAAYDAELKNFPLLQKIENIGDCYMVSSILIDDTPPKHLGDNCSQMFDFSKALIRVANRIKIDTRVGLHVGDVRMGIIGDEVPRLGIVGHNVNITARLESTCDVNCIQVSDVFYMHYSVEKFTKRKINLKNIGVHITYTYQPMPSQSKLHRLSENCDKLVPALDI